MMVVAFWSLISDAAFRMNSSGLSLNLLKTDGLIPWRIAMTALRVRPVSFTSLPIRSYFTLELAVTFTNLGSAYHKEFSTKGS